MQITYLTLSTISVCEDEFESKSNKDGTQISQKCQQYQTFYETWVKEVFHEWKEKPASNTTCCNRCKGCALACGSNILKSSGKEKAVIERHFSEVDLEVVENMSIEKSAYDKDAADFREVFTQQPNHYDINF